MVRRPSPCVIRGDLCLQNLRTKRSQRWKQTHANGMMLTEDEFFNTDGILPLLPSCVLLRPMEEWSELSLNPVVNSFKQ